MKMFTNIYTWFKWKKEPRRGWEIEKMEKTSELEIVVKRKPKLSTKKNTIGELWFDNQFQCFTLEDPVRHGEDRILQAEEKIYGDTAIPEGTYEVVLTFSNTFQKFLPILIGVDHFKGVRIHSGNRPADTKGCILVGMKKTDSGDAIFESRKAMKLLMTKLKKEVERGKVFITVKEES